MDTFTSFLKCIFVLLGLFTVSLSVNAHNKVVVIPLSGDTAERPEKVIVVSKSNGDFTDPVAAMNSIDDSSPSNRYLVFIAPGTYTLTSTLVMKPYVDVVGSGQNLTTLVGSSSTSAVGSSSTVVAGADHAQLKELRIENVGGGSHSIGVSNSGSSPFISNVEVFVTGASTVNYGILNTNGALPKVFDSSVTAKSPSTAGSVVVALACFSAGGSHQNVRLKADGADSNLFPKAAKAFAVEMENCNSTYIESASITALDGSQTHAIYATGATSLSVHFARSLFAAGTVVRAEDSANVQISHSHWTELGVSAVDLADISCALSTYAGTLILDENCELTP